MTPLERLQWAAETKLTTANAHVFVETLPDVLYEVEQRLEDAIFERDIRSIFLDTRKAGIIQREKHKDPKITEKHLGAIWQEELHDDLIELEIDDSVVRKWESSVTFVKNKLWSAKSLIRERPENV